jgi:NADPH:quinone reductase-like Zn-dependent oxidoreductase
LRLPVGQTLLLEILHRARQAKGGRSWGTSFAGRVEAVGSDVTSFEIGDRVFGFIGFSGPFGAHAEYVTIPEDGPLATILAT